MVYDQLWSNWIAETSKNQTALVKLKEECKGSNIV